MTQTKKHKIKELIKDSKDIKLIKELILLSENVLNSIDNKYELITQ